MIIESVHLAPGFIADEDDLQPPRIELGEVGTRYLHVCDAAEHSKVMYRWLFVVPGLIWRLPVKDLGWRPIEEIDGRHYRLSPETLRHPGRRQQRPCCPDDGLILAFHHSVLLGGVGRRWLPLYTELVAVLTETC